jgi:hypothetical protein
MEALLDHPLDDPLWDASWDEDAWQVLLESPRSLLASEPEALSADGILDQLVEVQREQSRLAALEARAMVALAGPFEHHREVTVVEVRPGDADSVRERHLMLVDEAREEISAALHRSPGVVYDQIATARLLAGPLRTTGRALADGGISASHARVLADQARRLTGALTALHDDPHTDTPAQRAERVAFWRACAELERRTLPWAEDRTPGQLRSRARRLIDTIDSDAQDRRRRHAQADIDVEVIPEDDGLALLLARLPLEDAIRLRAAIEAAATHPLADLARPIGHRRAYALLDAVLGTSGPVTVTTAIQVVVDLATLAGLADTPGTIHGGGQSPEPIAAGAVRDLLADPACPATLRRLVVDPLTGHLLDRGRRAYTVTDAMRAYLVSRDQTCRFPGCTRAAEKCQIDHATAWADGGSTDRDNLGPLCTRHHQLKTIGAWNLEPTGPDGSAIWRSPLGRHYQHAPPELPLPF